MAVIETSLPAATWTKVVDNAAIASFQNTGQWPVYINLTATNVAPTDLIGFVYNTWDKETKANLSTLTFVSTPLYVWAKPIGGKTGQMLSET
ncbi:MAG: hypothetical protein COA84_13250 [Robiginitomaculum sp.]|nr:MAG: hypothetical protein COA84_13250 [Robiginitomaculum sp.]